MGTQPTQMGEWKAGRAQDYLSHHYPEKHHLGESLREVAILVSMKFKSTEKITVKVQGQGSAWSESGTGYEKIFMVRMWAWVGRELVIRLEVSVQRTEANPQII